MANIEIENRLEDSRSRTDTIGGEGASQVDPSEGHKVKIPNTLNSCHYCDFTVFNTNLCNLYKN